MQVTNIDVHIVKRNTKQYSDLIELIENADKELLALEYKKNQLERVRLDARIELRKLESNIVKHVQQ